MDHPSLRFPEVGAAASVLCNTSNLRKPTFLSLPFSGDLLDWLFAFFQPDNIRNQHEHLVLHLSISRQSQSLKLFIGVFSTTNSSSVDHPSTEKLFSLM